MAAVKAIVEAFGLAKHFAASRSLRQALRGERHVVRAVDGIDLRLERGESVGLVGESGSGKTTVGRLLLKLTAPSSGRLAFEGEDLGGMDKARTLRFRQQAQLVFQNPYDALNPRFSVRRALTEPLTNTRVARAEHETRIGEALRLVHLTEHADKLPGQLSGGQQQRVAIARAIVIEPPLVLMDEPLSNLDAKLRLEMRQEIRRIHAQLGSTTIYVTHDQEEALSLADRIVVLRDGVIRQVGTPAELYATPAHLDVADFMGYRNRVEGKLLRNAGGLAVVDIGGATIEGIPRGEVKGERAIVAVRPDDLVPAKGGGSAIAATVEAIEYRGREFHGLARTLAGAELHFSSTAPLSVGAPVSLAADRNQVLIFPAEDA